MRLSITGLGKRYARDFWGLQDFTLEIDSGVVGILGPNGAGKSTLFRILATVSQPTTGTVLWEDVDIRVRPDHFRARLGYLPQDFGIYPHLTAVEFLTYLGAARGIVGRDSRRRISHLLDLVNLSEARHRKLGSMSGGMKQRVGIAQALLNDPQLLIVDEPTAGLDPEERIRFRNLLGELAGNRVVLLSSHIVSDIEAVASTVAVVARGRLLCCLTPRELLARVEGKVREWETDRQTFEQQSPEFIVSSVVHDNGRVRARVIGGPDDLPSARPVTPSLEDAYLYCLNEQKRKQ